MPPPLFAPAPAVVGHRGAPLRHPENTPAAFAAAAVDGAGWVELDARITADGGIAVHHDPALPGGPLVRDLTLAQLADRGVWSLVDVLDGLPAGLGVDVEVKNLPGEPDQDDGVAGGGPPMAVVAALLPLLAAAPARPLVVSSFNPMVLLELADGAPQLPLALLTAEVPLPAGLEAAAELGCAALFPHHTTEGLDADGIAAAHDAGLSVMVWTVDDVELADRLVHQGADAICTNDPAAVAGRVLRRSG